MTISGATGTTLTSHISSPHTGQRGRLTSNDTEVGHWSAWDIALALVTTKTNNFIPFGVSASVAGIAHRAAMQAEGRRGLFNLTDRSDVALTGNRDVALTRRNPCSYAR